MRKVDPRFSLLASEDWWLSWRDTAQLATRAILEWLESTLSRSSAPLSRPEPDASIWSALKSVISSPVFNGCCAYCESRYDIAGYGNIDHFRPKAGILGHRTHLGYFWLTYDRDNLLPVCDRCNTHKGTKFPTTNAPVALPCVGLRNTQELNAVERPLLLHPYFDDPRQHIAFGERGVIIALTNRGEAMVKACSLDREQLTVARDMIQEYVLHELSREAAPPGNLVEAFRKLILKYRDGCHPHGSAAYYRLRIEHARVRDMDLSPTREE